MGQGGSFRGKDRLGKMSISAVSKYFVCCVGSVTTDKLQRVLNAAARVVSGTHKSDRGLTCVDVFAQLSFDTMHDDDDDDDDASCM